MSSRFQIEIDGKLRDVEVSFGNANDAETLSCWNFPKGLERNNPMFDALEYARFASKRWRYYQRAGATVTNLAQLDDAIRQDPNAELP